MPAPPEISSSEPPRSPSRLFRNSFRAEEIIHSFMCGNLTRHAARRMGKDGYLFHVEPERLPMDRGNHFGRHPGMPAERPHQRLRGPRPALQVQGSVENAAAVLQGV